MCVILPPLPSRVHKDPRETEVTLDHREIQETQDLEVALELLEMMALL